MINIAPLIASNMVLQTATRINQQNNQIEREEEKEEEEKKKNEKK